jgi:cell division protein FtsL
MRRHAARNCGRLSGCEEGTNFHMSTLATFVNRFMGATELAEAPSAVWSRTDVPRLRPIANEDVYLFVKRIDNSSVIRAVDPAAQSARSKSMATGFVAAVFIIAGLVPTAYNVTAGFTLQQLRQEQSQLERQRAILLTEEARLVNPDRLRQLAKTLKMTEPEPQQVQTLSGMSKTDSPAEARVTLPFSSYVSAR